MVKSRVAILILWWLLVSPCLAAPASVEEQIKDAYQATCEAARLMYVDGLFSNRAPDHVVYDPKGTRVPFSLSEEARYQNLFDRSLSVTKRATVFAFKQLSPTTAQCEVHEVDIFEVIEPRRQEPVHLVIDSSTRDDWVLLDGKWKIKTSHVLKQTISKEQK
jgi:hypothetical protein